jgi:hypothetical protein
MGIVGSQHYVKIFVQIMNMRKASGGPGLVGFGEAGFGEADPKEKQC